MADRRRNGWAIKAPQASADDPGDAGRRPILGVVPDVPHDAPRPGRLEPGTKVEVRTGFDRSWAPGFLVESVTDDGYRVRRRSDDHVLPVAIAQADVRRERKNSMWWY